MQRRRQAPFYRSFSRAFEMVLLSVACRADRGHSGGRCAWLNHDRGPISTFLDGFGVCGVVRLIHRLDPCNRTGGFVGKEEGLLRVSWVKSVPSSSILQLDSFSVTVVACRPTASKLTLVTGGKTDGDQGKLPLRRHPVHRGEVGRRRRVSHCDHPGNTTGPTSSPRPVGLTSWVGGGAERSILNAAVIRLP
jgi:hypothetical protein